MTVHELWELLAGYPPEAEVYVEDPDQTWVMRTVDFVGDEGHWLPPSPQAVYLTLVPWDGPTEPVEPRKPSEGTTGAGEHDRPLWSAMDK